MIVILWTLVLISVGLGSWTFGFISGKATRRKELAAYKQTIYEADKFARQQSAVGDSTGTIISDMLQPNDKELN